MRGSREIAIGQDLIDSREVQERIKYLEEEMTLIEREEAELDEVKEELEALKTLQVDGRAQFGSEWEHGVTLISTSYFEEYAQDFAEDIGAISKDSSWPACHIDWEAAADALKQDYQSIEYGGVEYWGRG